MSETQTTIDNMPRNETTDAPEIRTLARMRRDAREYDEQGVQAIARPLADARRKARMMINTFETGSDGYRAAVDQALPGLDTVERATLAKLQHARTCVTGDLKTLNSTGYRPSLAPDRLAAAETKAARLRDQLPHLDAFQAYELLKGAVLQGDDTERAAWAMIGNELSNRFPSSEMLQDARGNRMSAGSLFGDYMRHCERTTGDRDVETTRETLTEALRALDAQIGSLTQDRNAHEPGNFGSVLVSHQYGARATQEQLQQERRYDIEAVNARFGKRSA